MRAKLIYLTAAVVLAGCGGVQQTRPTGEMLLVDFQEGQPLRYRMTSQRQTRIELTDQGQRQSAPQKMTERLELVMVYDPIEVDPFGLTKLQVRCESATVTRTSFSGRPGAADAMESLTEIPFTLTLRPTGQIEDMSDFRRAVGLLGDRAFAETRTGGGRVKNEDMISDFIALQWHLWDAIASIDTPLDGLSVGSRWQARQLLPWPVPVPNPPTRVTTFTLDQISEQDDQRTAHISSTYELTEEFLRDIPRMYEGAFQMRGLFGFLRGYRFESIEGGGTQVFNMDTGILESDRQDYALRVTADFRLPLGDSKPVLNVDQTISIERLK